MKKIKILYLGPKEDSLHGFLKKQNAKVEYFENKAINIEQVKDINPDLIMSYGYRHIIKKEIFENFKTINLHISLLPWNRGSNPNFWSFYDNTPKGVTIHKVAKGLDTGDILFQKEVNFLDHEDDLEKTYLRLKREMNALLELEWQRLVDGDYTPRKQNLKSGTYYTSKDFSNISNKLKNGWKTKTAEVNKWKKEQI